jgi:hypothetical protein
VQSNSDLRFTTPLQQQETVEAGEQERRRLVNRAKNGLALVREFPQEPDDVPRALTVQSRGRFVQKQQELGFRSELDTDRKTLAGFDVQRYDDRISVEAEAPRAR